MKSILSRRPSPALVISCIALFVSLGGVSYGVATGFIDSREIKNNQVRSSDLRNNTIRTFDIRNNEVRGFDIRNSSVQGRDVALNTLTGADVSEQDLGKVPSAAAADTAASVGGVTPKVISYAGETGSGFVPVLSLGGLTLEAAAPAGPAFLQCPGEPGCRELGDLGSSGAFTNTDTDFDPGDNILLADNPSNGTLFIAFAGADGKVVTVQASRARTANGVRGTTNDCGFFGVAQAG